MHQYLQDTEFAAQSLFQVAMDEERQLGLLATSLQDKSGNCKFISGTFRQATSMKTSQTLT